MNDVRVKFNKICKLTKTVVFNMLDVLKPYYSEKHRHFHNLDHILDILLHIEELNKEGSFSSEIEYKSFQCAALFHDVVYIPRNTNNEIMSDRFFKLHSNEYIGIDVDLVSELILGTSLVDDKNESHLVRTFNRIDRDVLMRDFPSLIEYGENIWKEYSFHDYATFLDVHFKLIRVLIKNSFDYVGKDNAENIAAYEKYMRSKKIRVGVYAGSFDPFHIGHLDVVKQTESLFDKVIVCRGVNPNKVQYGEDFINGRVRDIEIEGVPKIFQQTEFTGMLLSRYVQKLEKEQNYDVTVIRGFRDEKDISSELVQRKYSLEVKPEMKYVFIASSPGLEHISSSAIKTLKKFNEDVESYLPSEVN